MLTFILNHMPACLSGSGLLLILIYYLIVWFKMGRDPVKKTIVPRFYPPQNLSPAATRYLAKMGHDSKVTACALLSMAIKGYLQIHETAEEITLIRQNHADAGILSKDEKILAKHLYQHDRHEVRLDESALIYFAIVHFQTSLKGTLEKKYFKPNSTFWRIGLILTLFVLLGQPMAPGSTGLVVWTSIMSFGLVLVWNNFVRILPQLKEGLNAIYTACLWLAFSFGFLLAVVAGSQQFIYRNSPWLFAMFILGVLLNRIFYPLLKSYSLEGRRIMDEIEGFKMYLKTAESEELKKLGAPQKTKELVEQYLPYALALDMEQKWAESFADILDPHYWGDSSQGQEHWYAGQSQTASKLVSSLSKAAAAAKKKPRQPS